MRRIFRHIRTYIIRGIIASIPLVLTFFVIRFLYLTIDQRIMRMLEDTIGRRIPGLGLLILLAVIYLFGLIASNVIGRQIFSLLERITKYIPFIKTTYQVGKQISSSLAVPEKEVLKRPVLVEFLKPGLWTIGFVTGTITDNKNPEEKLLKIFIPTPPNPTSGTIIIAKESQTRDPGWTIEEAFRVVISGGIIGPEEIE